MSQYTEHNPDFLHHQHSPAYLYGREIVFGMQDGMVSVLGALTGIAVGSNDHFVVLLSGFSIICTASLSMAIGTYNSISTEKKIEKRILEEERDEIEKSPVEEKREIEEMFLRDGWPESMTQKMAECAALDNDLMLREMAYRELSISQKQTTDPIKKSIVMFFAWAGGGLVPLFPYFFLSVTTGIWVSIGCAAAGLFVLGSVMSKFTKQKIINAGMEMVFLGGAAIIVGYLIGYVADSFIQH